MSNIGAIKEICTGYPHIWINTVEREGSRHFLFLQIYMTHKFNISCYLRHIIYILNIRFKEFFCHSSFKANTAFMQ